MLILLILRRQWTPPMVSTECSSSVRQMLISTEKRGWVLGVGVLGTFRYVYDLCMFYWFYLAIWHGMCNVAVISQWFWHQCQVCPPGECSVSWHWSSRHDGRWEDLAASEFRTSPLYQTHYQTHIDQRMQPSTWICSLHLETHCRAVRSNQIGICTMKVSSWPGCVFLRLEQWLSGWDIAWARTALQRD